MEHDVEIVAGDIVWSLFQEVTGLFAYRTE